MFLLSIQPTKRPEFIGPPVQPPATNDSTDLDSLLGIGPAQALPSCFWDPKAIIEGFIQRAKDGIVSGDSKTFEQLFMALSAVTGVERSDKRMLAVRQFLLAVKDGKADVNSDGNIDGKDMAEVWKKGQFEVSPNDCNDFGRFDNPMDLLNTYVSQLARPEASLAPFFLITEKQLLNALKAVTGLDPSDSRITAIKDFAAYLAKTNQENDKFHGGYADVNGDGKTNAQDLIQVWKTGRFDLDSILPPPPPENENERIINEYLHKVILLANGAMFPVSREEGEKFFKALSKKTGCEDTESRRQAISDFLTRLSDAIRSHHDSGDDGYDYNKEFDRTGDGKLDAKDLEKIFSDV